MEFSHVWGGFLGRRFAHLGTPSTPPPRLQRLLYFYLHRNPVLSYSFFLLLHLCAPADDPAIARSLPRGVSHCWIHKLSWL
ncbi:hypothetical protein CGRA01v4_06966 [Colletotrichum graminicola]|nr:hypothetical protein CGRA01v4_06966 [Colletotrichum graminicola]